MYNRVQVNTGFAETTASWTYASTTVREIHGDTSAVIAYVRGVNEDNMQITAQEYSQGGTGSVLYGGICYNATNAFTGLAGAGGESGSVGNSVGELNLSDLGYNFVAQCEANSSTNTSTALGSIGPVLGVGMNILGRF